ncbi:hypothetical protein WJX74_005108 [Apatococcus lobatus]|uniref:non-specific serine/threonine protein kinase n=1 Tax=Apatococcus lobatus TaxID=904363 RepID=A0AAW1QNA2_9CHLO
MERYTKGRLLGRGSYGSAYLATDVNDGKEYVIKEIDITRMPRQEREVAAQEAQVLKSFNHPNVVRCKETFTDSGKLCIVMEYCSEGDLHAALKKRKNMPLSESMILDWFVQICLGLKHVHDRKVLHRDLKAQNIFMSAGGLLKLGDFGVSKVLSSTHHFAATAIGTPFYMSPEICQNKKYDAKTDIWSLGCILYEMITLRHPFEAADLRGLIGKIVRGRTTPLPAIFSKGLRDLVDSMLMVTAARRPNINDILRTPIVKSRIERFLSNTVRASEFSHTVIHSKDAARPASADRRIAALPGHAGLGVAGTPAVRAAPSRAANPSIFQPQRPSSAAAKRPGSRPGTPPETSPRGAEAASRARPPSPGAYPGAPGAPAPSARAPSRSPSAKAPTPVPQPRRTLEELVAEAKAKVAAARAAQTPAPVKAPARRQSVQSSSAEAQQQRQQAAQHAQREVERLRLEEERRRLEGMLAREDKQRAIDAKQAEAKKAEQARQAHAIAAREARAKAEADAIKEKTRRSQEARKQQELVRQKSRDEMRSQKRDWMKRQRESFPAAAQGPIDDAEVLIPRGSPANDAEHAQQPAAANPANARPSVQLPEPAWHRVPAAQPSGDPGYPHAAAAAPDKPPAQLLPRERVSPRERERPSSAHHPSQGLQHERRSSRDEQQHPTPDQRRLAYAEMQAAAARNKAAFHQQENRLAGVLAGGPSAAYQRSPSHHAGYQENAQRLALGDRQGSRPSSAQARKQEQPSRPQDSAAGPSPEERRQVWEEMQAAAARNKKAIHGDPHAKGPEEAQGAKEYAAMVADMEDVYSHAAPVEAPVEPALQPSPAEQLMQEKAQAGRFLLEGREIDIGIQRQDSLEIKVEALRAWLIRKLSRAVFQKVYHRLESLSSNADEVQVAQQLAAMLGEEKMCYLQLIHQLIVCEELLKEE